MRATWYGMDPGGDRFRAGRLSEPAPRTRPKPGRGARSFAVILVTAVLASPLLAIALSSGKGRALPRRLAAREATVDEGRNDGALENESGDGEAAGDAAGDGANDEGEDREDGEDEGRRREVPAEYRSGAVPNETTETSSRMERAESHFAREEWGAGLALLDEVLAEVTSPERARKLRNAAIRRRRALERAVAARKAAAEQRAAAARVAGPGARRAGGNLEVSDDVLSPTVEVYSRDGILYRSVAASVRERLLELPPEVRDLYRRTYEAPARAALEHARDLPFEERLGALRALSRRYPLTTAARDALEELGPLLADVGRFGEAARSADLRARMPFEEEASLTEAEAQALAAYYHLLAGHPASGRERLERLTKKLSESVVPVRGVAVLGASLAEHELFERLLRRAERRTRPPSPWPSVQGSYRNEGRSLLGAAPPAPGTEARWIFPLRDPRSEESNRGRTRYRSVCAALQAVTHGPRIYFRRGEEIVCLGSARGEVLWTTDLGPRPSPAVSSSRVRSVSPEPALDYLDLGGRSLALFEPPAGDLPSPARASAAGKGGSPAPAFLVVVDHTSGLSFSRTGEISSTSNRLLAFDAENGKLRWRIGEENGEGRPENGLSYLAPPTPAGGLLVAPATREGGYYLVGLEADSDRARVRWVSRLYSYNFSYFERYGGRIRHGSSLAAAGGMVYGTPGNGLVCAVEASTGDLAWLSRYRIRALASSSRAYTTYHGGTWVHTQPVLVDRDGRDLLAVAPQGSEYLTVFDARTGRTLWEKRFSTGPLRLLGTDGERLFVAGNDVGAFAVEDGQELWESERIEGGDGGLGFIAGERLYVPGTAGGLTVLETRSGILLTRLRVLDPRLPTSEPFNVFPLGGDLLTLSSAAAARLRPIDESWALVESRESPRLFQRARLLRGSGRYREALDILYELEATYREGTLHDKIREDILETVADAVDATSDARFIRELLARDDPIVEKREAIRAWRLREAELLESDAPAEAAAIYIELLDTGGRTATSPEGNTVDVSVYASDALRKLLQRTEGAGEEGRDRDNKDGADEGALSRALAERPALQEEEEETRRALARSRDGTGRVSREALQRIVTRRSHTPSAAEAGALLARLAEERGDRRAAANHLIRLLEDYPALRAVEAIAARLAALEQDIQKMPPTFRVGAPSGRSRAAAAVPVAAGDDAGPPPRPEAPLPRAGASFTEVFFHANDQGIAAASPPGSEPLPAAFALHRQKLRVFDRDGALFLERELPEFPDVEDVKLHLQSAIEEPVVAHLRDRILVLFTAAGCYGFDLLPGTGPDEPIDAASFRLRWRHNYPHALELFGRNRRFGWGSIRPPTDRNFFPRVLFTDEGDPVLLAPDGGLLSLDRRTGKIRWRFRESGFQVVGPPRREGPRFLVSSSSPPGLLLYALSGTGTSAAPVSPGPQYIAGPEDTRLSDHAPGIASAIQGRKLVVISEEDGAEGGGRELWSRSTSSRLVRVTPTAVWTTGTGNFKARSLRSGRETKVVDLPRDTRVVAHFEDPDTAGAPASSLTLVTSGGASYAAAYYSPYASRSQTGTGLHLVNLDGSMEVRWKRKIASGPVTYDGSRNVLPDGRWLLACNVQETGTERWYTRLVAVSPHDGQAEVWLETEISGKGTGQPPRLCALEDGLVLRNADGFGGYRRATSSGPSGRDGLPGGETGDGAEKPRR